MKPVNAKEYFNRNAACVEEYRPITFIQEDAAAAQKSVEENSFLAGLGLTVKFSLVAATPENVKNAKPEDLRYGDKVRGFVLPEDVTFDFKSGPYTAPKGSFFFENARDADGYTVDHLARTPLYVKVPKAPGK